MARARRLHDWNQSACILALTANCHRDPKRSRVVSMFDFLPDDLREGRSVRRGILLTPQNLHILKPLFTKRDAQPDGH